jgi:hypothetical protein
MLKIRLTISENRDHQINVLQRIIRCLGACAEVEITYGHMTLEQVVARRIHTLQSWIKTATNLLRGTGKGG